MARVIDTLREKINAISKKPELILNEQFIINIFKEYREELPPFQAYWDEMFNKKQMSVVEENRKERQGKPPTEELVCCSWVC